MGTQAMRHQVEMRADIINAQRRLRTAENQRAVAAHELAQLVKVAQDLNLLGSAELSSLLDRPVVVVAAAEPLPAMQREQERRDRADHEARVAIWGPQAQ